MELYSSSRPRRALIVEDEIVIALDLQDAMSAMGFDHCDLASTETRVRSPWEPNLMWLWLTFASMEAAKE
jgi:hypothetical protein